MDGFNDCPCASVWSHGIGPDVVRDAVVIEGEKYRPVLGDACSDAVWWCFGQRPEGGVEMWRGRAGGEGEKGNSGTGDEKEEKRLEKGEDPHPLALVIEGEEVVFEIV